MLEIALAKLAALGVTTKAAFGLATAASVVAVGGATGVVPVLPAPASDRAVQTKTTDEVAVTEQSTTTAAATTTSTDTEASEKAPADAAAFGQLVAADAKDGGVDGQVISDLAHQRNDARKAARELPAKATAAQTEADAAKAEREAAKADRTDHASETGVAARSQEQASTDVKVADVPQDDDTQDGN
jgi:hypothetical protein